MRRPVSLFAILSLCFLAFSCKERQVGDVHIVPQPQEITYTGGSYHHKRAHKIEIVQDSHLREEEYILEIGRRVKITCSSEKGEFYAMQTLSQIAGGDTGKMWRSPCLRIHDYPRFDYRGLMVDVTRYFTPKDDLLSIIDAASRLKINKLHLHLTDDNGWRIEIKKYPALTEVGSRRVERPGKLFPERENQRRDEPTVEMGYYTQDDIREIVQYAGERHIEVIPEIEMPAHSNAALAAYPSLACPTVKDFIGVLPGIGGHNAKIIYCAGNDKVFEMLRGVLDEVFELFPSKYIHLGGDEADKTHWRQCPLCRRRMAEEGFTDAEQLQGWFMERIASYVREKGRIPAGWDEVTNSKIPTGMVVYGWQGMGNAALKALRQGHRIVMTPAKKMYLIRYQGPQWFEPFTYFGNVTLKDVFEYDPVGKNWDVDWVKRLDGIQGSMWTEFCQSAEDVEYMIFPRLLAVSEVGWTLPQNKDWEDFIKGVDGFTEILDGMDITWARSMYNIQHTVRPQGDSLDVSLECIRPDVEIRKEWSPDRSRLTARSFIDDEEVGEPLELKFLSHKAVGCKVTGGGEYGYVLTNGLRGSDRCSDFEWTLGPPPFDNTFTVDLGKDTPIKSVTLGLYNNYGMGCHKPSHIEISISSDGKEFKVVAQKSYSADEIFKEGTFTEDALFAFDATARYIRCTLTSPGTCPDGHVREGNQVKVYTDEIIVL